MNQTIYLLGLNHRTAGVEIREKFAPGECVEAEGPFIPTQGPIVESLLLSTCNRVEVLVVCKPHEGADPVDTVLGLWAEQLGASVEDLSPYVYVHRDLDAVNHVFNVASSLDSMVVGEPQILGQIKEAYRESVRQGTTKVVLNRLLHKAFSVAKRVRTETAVASSAVSISYAAVELARKIFGDMGGYKAMLIGAGEMAELAATHLLRAGVGSILVANRTFERAVGLARQFHGEAIVFEELFSRLADVDIVISSTGASEAVIRARDVRSVLKRRKNRPMFFIDIAVPRDVDPDVNGLDNVYLYDIDDLKEVVEENLAQRREEAAKARAIVEAEAVSFGRWLRSLELRPTIVDLLRHGEDVAQRELAKTLKRLGPEVDQETENALRTLVSSLAKKLYHEPITFLKRRSEEEESTRRYVDTVRRLFNLDQDTVPPDAHGDRRANDNDTDDNGADDNGRDPLHPDL